MTDEEIDCLSTNWEDLGLACAQAREANRLRELLRRASEQPHAPHSWPQDLWDAIDKELGTCQQE